MRPVDRLGFFEQRSTSNAVFRVASKETDLTLFVGLGASLASDLPTWNEFARAIVDELRLSSEAEDQSIALDAVFESEDLLATMEIARSSWPNSHFEASMVSALYGRPPMQPERAISHEAIAELALRWHLSGPSEGRAVTILTTNYDMLIERALHRLSPSLVSPEHVFGSSEVLAFGEAGPVPLWEYSLGCKYGQVVANPVANSAWLRQAKEGTEYAVRVIHIHGIVTPDEVEGHIIATANDYYQDAESHSAARALIDNALRETTCLFLGTSLSDPLILGHLYNVAQSRTLPAGGNFPALKTDGVDIGMPYEAHWKQPAAPLALVLFSRESYPWAVNQGISEPTRRQLERGYSAMWRRRQLAVIWADYYAQPYQFLREVAFLRAQLAADHRGATRRSRSVDRELAVPSDLQLTYGKRIDTWSKLYIDQSGFPRRHIFGRKKVPNDPMGRYMWQQSQIRSFLNRYKQRALEHLLNVQDPFDLDEEWKLDLWVRTPTTHSMIRIASTQYEFLELPSEAVAYPIDFQSPLPAIRAFANGASTEDDADGRWRYYVAFPIRQTPEVPSLDNESAVLSRAKWGDLPVGSLVLSSTTRKEDSLLYRRPSDKVREVKTLLQVAGNEIVSFDAEEYDLASHVSGG